MALGASKIMTMLPSTPHVESVYLDPSSGILAGIPSQAAPLTPEHLSLAFEPEADGPDSDEPTAGSDTSVSQAHTLLIDGTTLDPIAAVGVARRVHEDTGGGALMLDAPVSGGEYKSLILASPRLVSAPSRSVIMCGIEKSGKRGYG
jgi:3-hydroxyisobutyrate dehydrogenase